MRSSVIPIRGHRPGAYTVVEAALPERPPRPIGVILIDCEADRAFLRLRPDFHDIAEADDAEVLAGLEEHFRTCTAEMGASAAVEYLEDVASNVVRVTDRQTIEVDAFSRVL